MCLKCFMLQALCVRLEICSLLALGVDFIANIEKYVQKPRAYQYTRNVLLYDIPDTRYQVL